MWRLPLFVVAISLFAQPVFDGPNLLVFNAHYERLFREYLGCPKVALTTDDCRPSDGVLNAKELKASCEAAKNLFGLQGKC